MNSSQLATSTEQDRIGGMRRRRDVARLVAVARDRRRGARRPATDPAAYRDHVVIRSAAPWDRAALERIAELDGGRVPEGDLLVAEVRGDVVAAIGLEDGHAIAHPFRPTAELLALLQLRREQLRGREAAAPRSRVSARARDGLRAFGGARQRRRRGTVLAGSGR